MHYIKLSIFIFVFFTAKGDELPKKPLGVEHPVVLTSITSLQPAKDADQQPAHPHTNNPITRKQPPPVPSARPVSPYTQAQCTKLQMSSSQPEEESLETPAAEERLVSSSARNSLSPEHFQTDSGEWPPPYLPSESDVYSVDSLNLPELPPPPVPYLDPEPGVDLSPLGDSLPTAPTQLDLIQEDLSTSPSSYRARRQFGKFPVNFYIPTSPSARRPSEHSHYDNLSEEEEQSGEKIPENEANRENLGLSSQPWPTPPSFFYMPDSAPAPPLKPATEHHDNHGCETSNYTFLQPPPEFANPSVTVSSPVLSYKAVQAAQNQNNPYRNRLQGPRLPVKPAALSSGPTPVCSDFNRTRVPNCQPPKPVTF